MPHAPFNLAPPKAGTAWDTQILYQIALNNKVTLKTKSCSVFIPKEELPWLLVYEGESSSQSMQKEHSRWKEPVVQRHESRFWGNLRYLCMCRWGKVRDKAGAVIRGQTMLTSRPRNGIDIKHTENFAKSFNRPRWAIRTLGGRGCFWPEKKVTKA